MVESWQGRLAAALILSACVAAAVAAPVRAMPQTIDYRCTPSWPEGDNLTIDWNIGRKSIHAQFPNGSEMDMARERVKSGFRYGEADTEIYGTSDQEVMVQEGGEPLRTCTADADE